MAHTKGDAPSGTSPSNVATNVGREGHITITFSRCGDPATFIHTIQGMGSTSAMVGKIVEIEGIVVGDYQAPGELGGVFVQEEDDDADRNPATSEGMFVYTSQAVSTGDKVRVRGTVKEYASSGSSLTELAFVDKVTVCGSGFHVTPAIIKLPVASLADWERYEGMLVRLPQKLTVTDNSTLARYGEISLSVGGRLRTPTSVVAPGAPAQRVQDLDNRSRILLDDGNSQQNIDPTRYPSGGLSAAKTLRNGDTMNGVTGVLDERFGAYRLQPVEVGHFMASNPRPFAPVALRGNLKIAGFNLLNYFNGDGLGGGFPTPRGATTAFEFARQRTKIISAIKTINADIVGLMELENDAPPHSAIEDLVQGLNDVAGAGTYRFINTGVIGKDEVKVGILYKAARVSPVGSYAVMMAAVNPLFLDTKNRPSLAQTFALNSTGARLTLVVNHLKSKGTACNDVGDPDTGGGQGNCNLTRRNAAIALAQWLATDPTGSGDPDIMLIGDMNAYAKEDPIRSFTAAGYVDLVSRFLGQAAYSYVFDGQSGYLDHALASDSLNRQVTGATEWHINADEPAALDYNVDYKTPDQVNTFYAPGPYRSSDHDPVVIGLRLNAPKKPQPGHSGS